MRNPALVQVAGPLAAFRAGFSDWLELVGYSRQVRAVHLRLMADLSGWLGERGLDGSAVGTPLLKEFVADRRTGGYRDGLSLRALRPLTEYLREIGIVSLPGREQTLGPVESFLAGYAVYLARERGLASATIQREDPDSWRCDCVHPGLPAERRAGDGAAHWYGAAIAAAVSAPARSDRLLVGGGRACGRRLDGEPRASQVPHR
jgi:hypothetical protein